MDLLSFEQFKQHKLLLLEADDTMGATPPPASPAMDMPPTSTATTPAPIGDPNVGLGMELPPDPTQPAIPEEPKPYRFVFIQDAAHKKWYGQADKDGGVKRFTVYEVSDQDLQKWIDGHSNDEDPDKIKAALTGKRKMPSSIYSDFKREVLGGELGTDKGPIDITFDSNTDYDNPATDDLSIVFLRSSN